MNCVREISENHVELWISSQANVWVPFIMQCRTCDDSNWFHYLISNQFSSHTCLQAWAVSRHPGGRYVPHWSMRRSVADQTIHSVMARIWAASCSDDIDPVRKPSLGSVNEQPQNKWQSVAVDLLAYWTLFCGVELVEIIYRLLVKEH